MTKNKQEIKVQSIKWPLKDNLPFLYANHFAIFGTDNEMVIAFGNFLPTGLPNRDSDELFEFISSAEVTPVAKIVMSKAGYEALLNIMMENVSDSSTSSEEK